MPTFRFKERRARLSLLVLLVSMLPALAVWLVWRQQEEVVAREKLAALADGTTATLHRRLHRYEQALLAGAGLFKARSSVSRQEWQLFITTQRLEEQFPGLLGLGYAPRLDPARVPAHIASVRREGFTDYHLRAGSPVPAEWHAPVTLIEPFSGANLSLFGVDLAADPTRRAALELAASSSETALSRRLDLAPPGSLHARSGLLLVAAIASPEPSGAGPVGPARGFVFAPLYSRELLHGLLADNPPQADLVIFDGDDPGRAALLYDSADERPSPGLPSAAGTSALRQATPLFSESRQLTAFGQTWTLRFVSRPEFDVTFRSPMGWMVLLLGSGISLLLALLTWTLIGRHQRVHELATEMTAQARQTQQALEERSRQTQAILDNAIDGIITIDQHGLIRTFNRAAERIFGYPASALIGHNVNYLMPEPYHSAHDGYLGNYRASGIRRIIGSGREVEGKRQDGSTFPLDLAVSEAVEDGQPLFIGIVRDISERKRVEQMKNEFVATVSHELRTPLTSISGALGLIAGGALGPLPEAIKGMLDIAYKNSQRLSHLINDLLDMEKIVAGKMHFDIQEQALWPLLEQAVTDNQAYAGQCQVRFLLDSGDDAAAHAAKVRVDSQRLLQVLANFLSNAAKFSPPDSDVRVRCQHQGRTVRVEVIDRGAGIPAEFQPRIFQKFSQADASDTRQKGGTGLGLAISKELVERMGGTVGFTSTADQGSTFFFELPLQQPATLCQEPAPSSAAPRILVVEDEPDIAQLLGLMLENAGYRYELASTAAVALERLATQDYAAVTVGLHLPDGDGLSLIHRIRQLPRHGDLPIVIVSASSEAGHLLIDGDGGDIDWLPKPIDEQRLLAAIARSLPPASAATTSNDGMVDILHVEDDSDLPRIIGAMAGPPYRFTAAPSLTAARQALAQRRFALIILDLTLPDGSGWELLPELRRLQPEPPVIILSGAEINRTDRQQVAGTLLKSRLTPQQLLAALAQRIEQGQQTPPSPAQEST